MSIIVPPSSQTREAGRATGSSRSVEAGHLDLVGSAAELVEGWRLIAEAGALTIAGPGAGAVAARLLVAAPGIWNWTGTPAGLTLAGRVARAAPRAQWIVGRPLAPIGTTTPIPAITGGRELMRAPEADR